MRKLLLALAAVLACGSAWADATIIRWDRFEASLLQADQNGCVGGNVSGVTLCPGRPRTVGPGRVMLNLRNGFLSFRLSALSNAAHNPNGPLGAHTTPAMFIGTVVCDSTERFGILEYVDTLPIQFVNGGGSFQGVVDLPDGCRARPEETVFLVRHYNPGQGIDGLYVAYGAGRVIH